MRPLLTLLFVFSFFLKISAQHTTHDIGFFAGNTTIFTDYGQSGDFESVLNGATVSFSVAHYLHFFNTSGRWNSGNETFNNLMIKSELSFYSTPLEQTGKWVGRDSDASRRLSAMKGSVSVINMGVQLEYYFKDLESFISPYSNMKLNPFVTFGINYALYSNTLEYDETLGLPLKYQTPGALNIGSGGAINFNIGTGIRYQLTEKLDLAAQFQAQIFLTDEIDGLQANVIENKSNEFVTILQVGVIYHLNFNQPLFSFF